MRAGPRRCVDLNGMPKKGMEVEEQRQSTTARKQERSTARATIASRMAARQSHEVGVVAIVATLVSLAATFPLVRHPGLLLPDLGDALFNTWVMGWVGERAWHGLSQVWSAPIFYPYPNTLAYAEPLLGIAVPLAPVTWLTGSPVFAHNLAVWLSFGVAAAGGFVLGRDLSGSRAGGMVAAAIAAFSPYRFEHLSHVQVLMVAWLWWVAWSAHRYFARPAWFSAVRVAFFVTLLGLSSLYWAYVAIVPLILIVGAEVFRRRPRFQLLLPHGVLALVLCATAFLPVALKLRSLVGDSSPVTSTVDLRTYAADLSSYWTGSPALLVWGNILPHGDGESDFFPGLVAILCGVAGLSLIARKRRDGDSSRLWVFVYAAVLVTGMFLSLGPQPALWGRPLLDNHVFEFLVASVPGFAQLRAPSRFGILVHLGLSVLAAQGMRKVSDWAGWNLRTTLVAGAIAAALVTIEGLRPPVRAVPFAPIPSSADQRAYSWLSNQPRDIVVELPLNGWSTTRLAMRYQYLTLLHGHRLVNGVARFEPPLLRMLADPESPLVDRPRLAHAPAFLRALGVRYVVYHEAAFADGELGREGRRVFARESGVRAENFDETAVFDLGPPPPVPQDVALRVLPSDSVAVASADGEADRAVDGNLDTRWISGRPQAGDERFDVHLAEQADVGGISLTFAGWSLNDYPRELTILTSQDGLHYDPVFKGSVLVPLALALRRNPIRPALTLTWPPQAARYLQLQQTGVSERWSWSVHELRVLTR